MDDDTLIYKGIAQLAIEAGYSKIYPSHGGKPPEAYRGLFTQVQQSEIVGSARIKETSN